LALQYISKEIKSELKENIRKAIKKLAVVLNWWPFIEIRWISFVLLPIRMKVRMRK